MSLLISRYSDLSDGIISAAKALNRKPKERKIIFITSGICVLASSLGIVIVDKYFNNDQTVIGLLIIFLLIVSITFMSSFISYFVNDNSRTLSDHLEKLAQERDELNDKIKKENNVLDVIKVNLNQLDEYYALNKVQARRSYSFSITMIIIGFIVLISAIVLLISGKIAINITIIISLSGLISEFIGATSLMLYKESTKQIQVFFNKLSYLQHIMLAVELAEKVNADKREEQISIIISSLIKSNENISN